jgi:hypothetical protein
VARPSKLQGGSRRRSILPIAAFALGTLAGAETASGKQAADAAQDSLRVCADPNNLPFSNARGEGFENALAELLAGALGKKVAYTWWAQRRGFIRNTLNAGTCDVIMGVPQLDMIGTTRPYYRSTYVFVSRKDRALAFSSMQAPELRTLRVGVHLIGDDGANTPPAHALGQQHIVDNVVGYMIYGDYREDSPPARLIEAVSPPERGRGGGQPPGRRRPVELTSVALDHAQRSARRLTDPEGRQHLLDRIDHPVQRARAGQRELVLYDLVDQGDEGIPVAAEVDQDDQFVVVTELA